MQKQINRLRNPEQSKIAHGGLAASPVRSAQGSTIFYPWIPAHAAVTRVWPFMANAEGADAPVSQAKRVTGAGAAEKLPPVGNTGGSFGANKIV